MRIPSKTSIKIDKTAKFWKKSIKIDKYLKIFEAFTEKSIKFDEKVDQNAYSIEDIDQIID